MILVSCNSKTAKADKKIDECEVTYIILTKENAKYCNYLSEEIKEKVATGNVNIKKYNSLTVSYVKYLDNICDSIRKNSTSIFFEGDNYSKTGKEFIRQTQEYKTAVETLAGDDLKKD